MLFLWIMGMIDHCEKQDHGLEFWPSGAAFISSVMVVLVAGPMLGITIRLYKLCWPQCVAWEIRLPHIRKFWLLQNSALFTFSIFKKHNYNTPVHFIQFWVCRLKNPWFLYKLQMKFKRSCSPDPGEEGFLYIYNMYIYQPPLNIPSSEIIYALWTGSLLLRSRQLTARSRT